MRLPPPVRMLLGSILAWTQPLKNGHNQNSFSEKHENTVFQATLAITTSDTNTAICGCVRGCAQYFGGCAQQKGTFAVHNLRNTVPTTSITVFFLTNRSNSCRSGFKFRIEFGGAFGDEKDDLHFVRVEASTMNAFTIHMMPGMPPNQASMLSLLMAAARAKSAAFIRMIHDDNNEFSCWLLVEDHTCTQYSGTTVLLQVIE